jgi:hypothetical protein
VEHRESPSYQTLIYARREDFSVTQVTTTSG